MMSIREEESCMNRFKEQAMKIVFMVAACASVLAVFLICLFLFANGIPAIAKIGPLKFLLERYGNRPMTNLEFFQ